MEEIIGGVDGKEMFLSVLKHWEGGQGEPKIWRDMGLSDDEYQRIEKLMGREPNFLEVGIFSVMWSEHCSYKTSKPVLKKFPTEGPQVLQGPGENAGIVDIGDDLAVAFKMESHNHPSAVEPYQGAATGVGILRDVFTMGARPVAVLNSLRFGPLTEENNKYLLDGVVSGNQRLWQLHRYSDCRRRCLFPQQL